ncbi:thioesterase family protein [Actinophytocola sp.]|uniref:thioesterase family protein n=1 Tax=Actinophytocola sp. TaxID=1872138 RepID=UPI002D7F9BB1|nr:thioesterase family protein [Actinophytocola sp.]HET9140504.1 thioesterase family protein [Actinophytocola sp.]HEU5108074.1 thioesterase family protein [Micromonosporaceae bacterium]
MGEAFFEPLGGGRFRSTEHTNGPWAEGSQHLGPPSALLTRELERLPTTTPSMISRITVEILGPVPVAELEVSAAVERPGRSVELLAGEIRAGGRTVVRGRAWRIVRSDSTAVLAGFPDPISPPEEAVPVTRPEGWGNGYLDAMEWRALRGSFAGPGPATIWARAQVDLVAGEPASGLQRLLTVADSGNGVSNRLDPRHWWFINTELTVHLYREPTGEWIGIDANTVIGPDGIGAALSTLHDLDGPVAAGAQSLMVRPR